ncbi:hypothetical protein Cgig2_032273 [Carnegiea gigantea]|uniref:Uncharacterized protein n=1 Tax=Carnegiea gigantea TaxID=171969 RepID=A0A9Q1GSW1_9CARY|nr:hypothetical protein Cgig2_032273 [Carnegiea gigantea]
MKSQILLIAFLVGTLTTCATAQPQPGLPRFPIPRPQFPYPQPNLPNPMPTPTPPQPNLPNPMPTPTPPTPQQGQGQVPGIIDGCSEALREGRIVASPEVQITGTQSPEPQITLPEVDSANQATETIPRVEEQANNHVNNLSSYASLVDLDEATDLQFGPFPDYIKFFDEEEVLIRKNVIYEWKPLKRSHCKIEHAENPPDQQTSNGEEDFTLVTKRAAAKQPAQSVCQATPLIGCNNPQRWDWQGNPEYRVAQGNKWLRGGQGKVPWAKFIWSRPNVPRHAFTYWVMIKHSYLVSHLKCQKPQNFQAEADHNSTISLSDQRTSESKDTVP